MNNTTYVSAKESAYCPECKRHPQQERTRNHGERFCSSGHTFTLKQSREAEASEQADQVKQEDDLVNQSQEHRGVPSAEARNIKLEAALSYLQGCHAERGDRLDDESEGCWLIDSDSGSIAEMQCPVDVEEAIAHLLAAAPALYEAASGIRERHNAKAKACNFSECGCDDCFALECAMVLVNGQDTNTRSG